MTTRRMRSEGQVLLFPEVTRRETQRPFSEHRQIEPGASLKAIVPEAVICGSFRKDVEVLKDVRQELLDLGFRVLSPTSVDIVSEKDGFVVMRGEETETAESIELRHLRAITTARFVWLHAPEGYVGPTGGLEIGFAAASGTPVFSDVAPQEPGLGALVNVVSSPRVVATLIAENRVPPPPPAIRSFQTYYAQAAIRRGYENESAENCLLLMLEEMGELARTLRKRLQLRRDGLAPDRSEADELADVFIYVVHMANILGIDLADAVQAKEEMNIQRFLAR